MTSLDDHDLFSPTTPVTPTAEPRKCRRHEWVMRDYQDHPDSRVLAVHDECRYCGKVRDEALARRGRNSRTRGNTIQRQRNRALGITNLPGNRPNHDGGEADELFVSESKSGAAFSERYWRWLTSIPRRAGQIPLLLVTSADGRKARSYVVVGFDDWADLHANVKEEEA